MSSAAGPPGPPPDVHVEVAADLGTQRSPAGFLRLRCRSIRRRFSDGGTSDPFTYDVVERRALDAVVILLYRKGERGTEVCLRSQLRVPLVFRAEQEVPDDDSPSAVLWELPAGLIEPGERGPAGIAHRASLETFEETGYRLDASRFEPFGAPCYPTPGLIAEKFHFVRAELFATDLASPPEGDGHVLEQGAQLCFVELAEALRAAAEGQLQDAKTEIGLWRLRAALEPLP